MNYVNMAYRLFGGTSKSLKAYFLDIKDDMQKANITYTLEEYLSIAFLTVSLTFFIEAVTLSFMLGFFLDSLLALLAGFILSLALSGMLFFAFYAYPATMSRTRENKIKKVLPFVVSYMATMSSSKMPPITLFKTMSQFEEYGEVAEESKSIANSVELFGLTASAAIKKQAKITPSKEFRDLLWGMNTIMASGGDLTGYLKNKSDELMNDYRRRIRKYAQDLSLYVEIYLTLIITGSIFFIVLSSIISAISAGLDTVLLQTFIVFILLPLLSVGFVVLVKSISPLE